MRKSLTPKTSLQVIIPLVCSTSAATMLDQGFSVHHEAHEGHKERTSGLENRPDFNIYFSSFVLFVSFVVAYSGSSTNSVTHCTRLQSMVALNRKLTSALQRCRKRSR